MRARYNTVVVDARRHEARLIWVEEGEVLTVEAWETPFSIEHDGELVDVEVVVTHDVKEFGLRRRVN